MAILLNISSDINPVTPCNSLNLKFQHRVLKLDTQTHSRWLQPFLRCTYSITSIEDTVYKIFQDEKY